MTVKFEPDSSSQWMVIVDSAGVESRPFPVIGWQVSSTQVLPVYVGATGQVHSLIMSNHVRKYRLVHEQWDTHPVAQQMARSTKPDRPEVCAM